MKKAAIILTLLILTSCSTYTITPDQLKEQFIAAGEGMDTVKVNNPLFRFSNITYTANRIKKITVLDKQGLINYLDNSPSLEMRITQKNGKRQIMYFDTTELRNDTLYGSNSRFLGTQRKVPFESIAKIEIQDGGKNYYYKN
ncbi:hypothetical protein [Flavobacterium sp. NRK1]|uniref:hypothetical protein n=1 Tax=Flavobacterium sp. NRK1 TaxID=2954929 RepID=UPI002092D66A|nr:hypothetical protein [Flavobacterium sp. NRK1]MCO6147722.1 hypothetical protein [Flavobacterium sp. NRK1]